MLTLQADAFKVKSVCKIICHKFSAMSIFSWQCMREQTRPSSDNWVPVSWGNSNYIKDSHVTCWLMVECGVEWSGYEWPMYWGHWLDWWLWTLAGTRGYLSTAWQSPMPPCHHSPLSWSVGIVTPASQDVITVSSPRHYHTQLWCESSGVTHPNIAQWHHGWQQKSQPPGHNQGQGQQGGQETAAAGDRRSSWSREVSLLWPSLSSWWDNSDVNIRCLPNSCYHLDAAEDCGYELIFLSRNLKPTKEALVMFNANRVSAQTNGSE